MEMSDKPCKWTEKVKGAGPKGEDVWTVKHCTRAELLESIQRDGPRFVFVFVLTCMHHFQISHVTLGIIITCGSISGPRGSMIWTRKPLMGLPKLWLSLISRLFTK